MKILFVQPSERPLIKTRKVNGSITPPLGIMTLAAFLRLKFPQVKVSIKDYEADNGPNFDFKPFGIVCVTGTTVHMPHAYELVRQIRMENPEALIIIGGSHATFCYDQLLSDLPELDGVVRGEGEITISRIVKKFAGKNNLPIIEGFKSRSNSKNGMSKFIDNLDDLPIPAYDLINLNRYQLSTHRKSLKHPFACLMTARGCPFSCSYCQTPNMFGRHLRYQCAEKVLNDIEILISTKHVKSIVFWDDTFTANSKRTTEICDSIKHLGIEWMCNTRVEYIDVQLLQSMKESGCKIIFYGVESGNEDILKLLNRTKEPMLEKVRNAFKLTHDVGIETVATLMIGAPTDTEQTIKKSLDFLKELNPTHVYFSIYNVTPGAAEYKRAVKEGLIRDENNQPVKHPDWSNYRLFTGPPFGLPTVNKNLSRWDLQNALKYAYGLFGKKEEYL